MKKLAIYTPHEHIVHRKHTIAVVGFAKKTITKQCIEESFEKTHDVYTARNGMAYIIANTRSGFGIGFEDNILFYGQILASERGAYITKIYINHT